MLLSMLFCLFAVMENNNNNYGYSVVSSKKLEADNKANAMIRLYPDLTVKKIPNKDKSKKQ